MSKLLAITGVFLSLYTSVDVQAADAPSLACKVYDSEADAPESVGTLMDRYGDRTARACVDVGNKLVTYSSLSAVAHNRFSVCQFEEIPRPAGAVTRTNSGDIVTFMLLIEGDCPSQGDKRYIAAQHVSTGLFVALHRFWDELSRSDKTFDAAFSLVPPEQRAAAAFEDLRDRFLKNKPAPRLRTITLQAGTLFGAYAGYVLKSEDEGRGPITIFVELTDAGLKAMAVGRKAS